MSIANWNMFCPTTFGTGASKQVGEKAKGLGMSKVLVVTEADLIKFGVATQVIDVLKEEGLEVLVFDKIKADAPSDICDEGGEFAKANGIDGIVAVGGGSSMDTAKAIALLTANEGPLKKYFFGGVDIQRGVPLITIPTTAGTGSENSQYLVIADSETGLKRVPEYAPDLALVDPVLTYSLPKSQTCATGMDALAHCCEAITSKNWNPYAYALGAEGIRLVMKYLPIAVREPNNAEAREKMALAANIGGMVITPMGCQLGHTWAQCFGGVFHVSHGFGCAWGLPGSMWWAGKNCPEDAKIVADAMDLEYAEDITPDDLANLITDRVVDLMKEIGIQSCKAAGYSLEDALSVVKFMPEDAAIANAPGNPTIEDLEEYVKVTYNAYQ